MRKICLILAITLSACSKPVTSQVPPTVIKSEAILPCSLAVRISGPTLGNDTSLAIGISTARDSRGLYYTTPQTGVGYQVVVRDKDGKVVRTIGRNGDGPGEFAKGQIPGVFIDAGDSVHVRHNPLLWSVFDSSGKFVRRMSNANMGFDFRTTTLLPDGTFLVSVRSPMNVGYFNIVSRNGVTLKSFGAINAEDEMDSHVSRPTAAGKTTFWAAARPGSAAGYSLEEWTFGGHPLRALFRETDWFPAGKTTEIMWPHKPPPVIDAIHLDTAGILIVQMQVPKEPWKVDESRPPKNDNELFIHRYEAIDTRSGKLLATVDSPDFYLPRGFFGSSREGFRPQDLQDGTRVHQIVSYSLVSRTKNSNLNVCR